MISAKQPMRGSKVLGEGDQRGTGHSTDSSEDSALEQEMPKISDQMND
jgi:hypothetical protein